jgi:hypothetical protein
MLLTLLLSFLLLTARPNTAIRHFHKVSKELLPRSVIEKDLCEVREEKECWQDFQDNGEVWAGDVNDDGVDELLVFPGGDWSGTAGETYILYQSKGVKWVQLLPKEGGWQVNDPRFDILPVLHDGYHDLRVAAAWCLKWNGENYVDYEDVDYHLLSPDLFDSSNREEADIFWAIRYKGRKKFNFEPQWFPRPERWTENDTNVEDPELKIVWTSLFKGGVWGVSDKRAFLLLPRPAYLGAEQLELDGDWVVIRVEGSRDIHAPGPVIARYNRKTHELRIEQ